MLLLLCAVVGTLWLAAADRYEASRSLVFTPDGTIHHMDSIASNDTRPLALEPGSVVSALKCLVTG